MEKTNEELAAEKEQEAAKLIAEAKALRLKEKPAGETPPTKSDNESGSLPSPRTGFYPQPPKRVRFEEAQICSHPDKKPEDAETSKDETQG
jgi:hypothetical protein